MLFELRQYQAHPGKRDALVELMDTAIIPLQISKGMSIVGSFVGEEDPNLYVWIRRFESEAQREALYEAVYKCDEWINELSPQITDLMNRETISVTRLNPTSSSALH